MLESLAAAAASAFDPFTLLVVFLSALFGLVIGSLPGLTATLGAALLMPFTFFLDPLPAIASIIAMSATAIFAGDIPGALVRMPGTPSSAAYVEDTYQMTQRGRGATALTISLVASVFGGLFGSVVLMFIAPLVGEFALQFTSYEYFWVAVVGLTAAVIVSHGSQLKGGVALMVGLLLSTVGLDVTLGYPRFTFGNENLYRGIDFIPAMIGLFGLSEVIRAVSQPPRDVREIPHLGLRGAVGDGFRTIWRFKGRQTQGNVIGSVVGALPGAGADIAAWVSYAFAKTTGRVRVTSWWDRRAEPLVAASAANNAALGSAFIPTLAFGIPGDTITAILIGVLLVKGIQPGPDLFLNQTDTLYGIFIVFILANLVLLPLGLAAIRASGLVLRIPRPALMAVIVALSVTGAYAINNGYVEVWMAVVLGVVGFVFDRFGIPLAPVVLGLVLGPVVERNFMQSVIKTNWDLTQFFTRPISAVLVVIAALFLLYPLLQRQVVRLFAKTRLGRRRTEQGASGA